jgi:hypothetical protein
MGKDKEPGIDSPEDAGVAPKDAPDTGAAVRARLRCTFCHDSLDRFESVACASCLALHHPDCFT